MIPTPTPEPEPLFFAIAPLIGARHDDDAAWLGALLARLLTDQLAFSGLDMLDPNTLTEHLHRSKLRLPLKPGDVSNLLAAFELDGLAHGRFVLDEESKMFGLQLAVHLPGRAPQPVEAAAPVAGFNRFIERLSLALIEQLNVPVDDALRASLRNAPRPANLEAFRQLALAHAAWAKGQNELALTALEAAFSLDAQYEEITALQVAVARDADDTTTGIEAFKRWATFANRQGDQALAAERITLLGHWLFEQAQWQAAQKAYQDAGSIYKRFGDELGEARALDNLANLDLMQGKPQEAIKTYRRSLRLFEETPEAPELARIHYNLSLAHRELGQPEEALQAVESALSAAAALNLQHIEGLALAQRGLLRADQGLWTQASADYSRAEHLLAQDEDVEALATLKMHQALLYKQQGGYDRAEALLLEAMRMIEEDEHLHPHAQALLWLNLGDLYFAMTRYEPGLEAALQAEEALNYFESAWAQRAEMLVAALRAALEPPPAPLEAIEPLPEPAPEPDASLPPSAEAPPPV